MSCAHEDCRIDQLVNKSGLIQLMAAMEKAKLTHDPRDPAYPLFSYRPGHYDFKCYQCDQVKQNGAKDCFQCHDCALKQAGLKPLPPAAEPERTAKIGARVRIMLNGRETVGVVCAADDPARSGTYQSEKHGAIPVRLLGNRKARRREDAKSR